MIRSFKQYSGLKTEKLYFSNWCVIIIKMYKGKNIKENNLKQKQKAI
jgi:hypothetical protein